MHEYAYSFVSPLLTHQLSQRGGGISAPVKADLDAAVLFTDISGFTSLADQISSSGPEGVEKLTNLVNSYFSDVIGHIRSHGGLVANFAGDAVLALWAARDEESVGNRVSDSARCAIAIQESSHRFSEQADLTLTTRAAITSGPLVAYAVGSGQGVWAPAVLGAPLMRIGDCLRRAGDNQIIVAPEAVAAASGHLATTELDDGFVILDQVEGIRESGTFRSSNGRIGRQNDLLKFVPRAVRSRLDVGAETLLSELRRPTIVFVSFPGIDGPIPLDELQEIMDSTDVVLEKFEGTFDKWNCDDKGTSVMLAFGLPPVAHEDDARRALLAAAELQSTLAALGVSSAIGVATGRTYCGPVGNNWRREYTVIGSAVNHAARLMQLAEPGTVLCDEPTRDAFPAILNFESASADRLVVGATVVRPYKFTGENRSTALDLAYGGGTGLIGRFQEISVLNSVFNEVKSGQGSRVIVIEGEPGIGKSAFVTSFVKSSREGGTKVRVVQADPIERATPFHAWVELFNELLVSDDPQDVSRISGHLEMLSIRPEMAPLLSAIISVEIEDNPTTQQLDGQARADATNEIAARLFDGAGTGIQVLVVEDAHWLDPSSWTLLRRIIDTSVGTLAVISTRPSTEHGIPELNSIAALELTTRLQMRPLSAEDAIKVVADKLAVHRLPRSVERLITDRAGGHPLFSEQLVLGLIDQGILEIRNDAVELASTADEVLRSTGLSDSVRGVINTRIDRLPATELLLLKMACVYGLEFEEESLLAIYPAEITRSELHNGIDLLVNKSLLAAGDQPGNYRFSHPLVQEVTYDQMTFADRRQVHSAVAHWYETKRRGELEQLSPVLAHHWHRADDADRATGYYEKSGSRSMRDGSYGEAVGVFENLLSLASKTTQPASSVKLAEWEHNLGQAQLSRGYLDESLKSLVSGFRHSSKSWPEGKITLTSGTLLEVLRQTGHLVVPRLLTGRSNREELLRAAALCESIGQVMYHQNRVNEFLYSILRFLNLSEKAPPSALSARAYGNAASVAGFLGLHKLARRYVRNSLEAVNTSEWADDHGLVNEYVGMYFASVGNWPDAAAHVQKAVDQFQISGNRRRQLETRSLTSMMQVADGDLHGAAQTRSELLDQAESQDDLQIYAWALLEQAETAMHLGHLDFAVERIDRAESRDLNLAESERIWMLGLKAAILTRLDDVNGGVEAAVKAQALIDRGGTPAFYLSEAYAGVCEAMLAAWDETEGSDGVRRANRSVKSYSGFAKHFPGASANAVMWRGLYEAKRGKTGKGLKMLRSGLDISKVSGVPYVTGLIQLNLAELLGDTGRERDALLSEAVAIFDRIGASREAERAKRLSG